MFLALPEAEQNLMRKKNFDTTFALKHTWHGLGHVVNINPLYDSVTYSTALPYCTPEGIRSWCREELKERRKSRER